MIRGEAYGHPGSTPNWTSSAKQGIGTALSSASPVWFTLGHGILNEIYFPGVDTANTRDAQYLVADDASFMHEEKRDMKHCVGVPPVCSGIDDYDGLSGMTGTSGVAYVCCF